MKPQFDTLARVNARCVIVTARAAEGSRPGVDFISRVFAPRGNIRRYLTSPFIFLSVLDL